MNKQKCSKCNHEWIPRVTNPAECPKCKRRDWRVKKQNKEEAF